LDAQERPLVSRKELKIQMIRKTTEEIRQLVSNAELDFEAVVNEALNAYLPRIFQSCPISEDLCEGKQCRNCSVFKDSLKKTIR
jgi:hypothetical protein